RPCREFLCPPIVAFAAAPKGSAGEQQVEPDRKSNRSNSCHRAKPPRCPRHGRRAQGSADRVSKNNSTYSMNWARKCGTAGPLFIDCQAARLRAERLPVGGPGSALT